MSAVDPLTHLQVIPESRRHESPVVIDVDALDADDVVYVGSAHPSQSGRVGEGGRTVPVSSNVVHATDNEEDNEIQFIGYNRARLQPPPVRRTRIFSPPPPPQIGGIPPVPQIPQRFLRPRLSPGLVIPNEDPFPFEADLRPPPPANQSFPVASAPSHHLPSMGFGGALLAGVQRFIGPSNAPQRPQRRNGWGLSGSFIVRWDPFDFAGGEEEDWVDEIGFLGEENNPFTASRVRNQIEQAFKQHPEGQTGPDYRPRYTHPDGPLPGFTHDLSPSPSPSPPSPSAAEEGISSTSLASGSGTRLCEATLVCAACRDPLVLGASDVREDRARRKLWGLRCGHLLDGKCIEKLMEPASPVPDATGSNSIGKITTEPMEEQQSLSQDTPVVDSDVGSMRSRLRPRRGIRGSHPSTRHSGSATLSSGRRGVRPLTAHRNNRKGKGKMKAPIIDAEHQWSCPVSGCELVHLSLLIDGRWTMDEKRGAIAVFA